MTVEEVSRRRMLAGGAAVATTLAAQGMTAGSAAAATTYKVNPYGATAKPTATELHYLNRLGCGFSRSTFAQLQAAGSASAWLDQQLDPTSIPQAAIAAAIPGWYPQLREAPGTKWAKHVAKTKEAWEYAADLSSYSMLHRIYSTRQVFETMVEFWSTYLHVNSRTDLSWVHRVSYDDTLRAHALGKFEDLLTAAALHPAMLLYLDNWRSVRNAPNENQGRELLELHTVGRGAGYTEQMVKDSAKILSGFTVDAKGTWNGYYDPAKHTTGPVTVLGFSSTNPSPDGQQLTRDYLRYLARHPATATNIATKLGRYFVADSPSTSLVSSVADAYLSSGTDIAAALRALVAHPDFLASQGQLTRTPVEDWVATCRALRVTARKPVDKDSFAWEANWVLRSTLPFEWPRPDGSPRGDASWASATRMLNSFRMHWNLAGRYYPKHEVTYRTPGSWLPQSSLRMDRFVDHLCRMVLGRSSTPELLAACVAATGFGPATVVTRRHALANWCFVRLVSVLLDSPDHMRR